MRPKKAIYFSEILLFPKILSLFNKKIFIEQKGCAYYEKSADYEWGQSLENTFRIIRLPDKKDVMSKSKICLSSWRQ